MWQLLLQEEVMDDRAKCHRWPNEAVEFTQKVSGAVPSKVAFTEPRELRHIDGRRPHIEGEGDVVPAIMEDDWVSVQLYNGDVRECARDRIGQRRLAPTNVSLWVVPKACTQMVTP